MILSFTWINNHESQEFESMWMGYLWGEGGLSWRVLLVLAVSSLVEDACGRVIEGVNCDSLGRKAPLVVVLSVLLLMVCSCYWR